MGVKEQIIFPEIEYDKIDAIRGMNITDHHHARTDGGEGAARGVQISVQKLSRRTTSHGKTALINREQEAPQDGQEIRRKRKELIGSSATRGSPTRSASAARLKLQRCRATLTRAAAQPLRAHRAARGAFRKFGLARNKLRDIAMRGEIPGVIKASW